jgi:2-methylcitrate dehydratase PrpD
MAQETVRLAEYAAALRYQDLPAPVVKQAKECIIDTVAAAICGSALPWSRIVNDYVERTGPGGKCHILGRGRRCRRRLRRSPMARSPMPSSSTA